MPELKKMAIVTGGSRGIGRAIVERLAKDGYHVLFTYVTNRAAADTVIAGLNAQGLSAEAVQCDIAKISDIEALFTHADKASAQLSVVINNAAVYVVQPLEDLDEATFDTTLAANTKGAAFVGKAAATRLQAGGRLIFISSLGARQASPDYIGYVMSKAALNPLIRTLAHIMGPKGATVNAVAPGLTDTEMTKEFQANTPPEIFQIAIDKTAMKRIGQPSDIANTVAFLASADGGWITGQTIEATGGHSI